MIELNKNENTILLPNVAHALDKVEFNRYSFLRNDELHAALAKRFNAENAGICTLDEKNFILGSGSSDCMFMFFNAIAKMAAKEGKKVAIKAQWPSFEVVLDYARALGFIISYDVALIPGAPALAQLPKDAVIIHYECSPNNPSGIATSQERLEYLASRAKAGEWVILDEAYAEFSAEHKSLPMASNHILHVRTFSKAYGLAGARIGYACGSHELIKTISEFYNPDRINTYAFHLALAALKDSDFLERLRPALAEQKRRVLELLDSFNVHYFTPAGNFVLHEIRSSKYAEFLATRGIATGATHQLETKLYNRVSIGGKEDTTALIAAMNAAHEQGLL